MRIWRALCLLDVAACPLRAGARDALPELAQAWNRVSMLYRSVGSDLGLGACMLKAAGDEPDGVAALKSNPYLVRGFLAQGLRPPRSGAEIGSPAK